MVSPGAKRLMERCTKRRDALLMGVQIKLITEECALGMGQRNTGTDALLLDAQIKLITEECALGMEQSSNYVAAMNARILL